MMKEHIMDNKIITNMDKGYPLIIVFYLDREMMMNKEILIPFTESVNNVLAIREANAVAFFLPTDGVERVECINPITTPDDKMDEINEVLENIKANFDIGRGADEETPEE